MMIMRLALLLLLAYAAEDHIKPAEFLSKWGTDELPPTRRSRRHRQRRPG